MSLMAHLLVFQSGGVEGISTNRCLAWWSGAVGPIVSLILCGYEMNPDEATTDRPQAASSSTESSVQGRKPTLKERWSVGQALPMKKYQRFVSFQVPAISLNTDYLASPSRITTTVNSKSLLLDRLIYVTLTYALPSGEVRISIDSTKLTSNAQSDLIQMIEVGRLRLSVWSIPAVVVLATNDLLKSMERTEEEAGESAYLVGTLTASMSLWRIRTPDEDRRQGEWLAASGMLIGRDRQASLLVSDFNKKIRKLISPAHSSALGEEAVSRWMMPSSSGVTALMNEIRGYMVRPHYFLDSCPRRSSDPSLVSAST